MLASFKSFSRFLVAIAFCALLLLSNALPASAIESYQSSPTEGETQLPGVIRKSEEVSRSAPRSQGELQRTQEGQAGLNAVQGTADAEKMNRPENSSGATSVETKIKEGLKDFLNE